MFYPCANASAQSSTTTRRIEAVVHAPCLLRGRNQSEKTRCTKNDPQNWYKKFNPNELIVSKIGHYFGTVSFEGCQLRLKVSLFETELYHL